VGYRRVIAPHDRDIRDTMPIWKRSATIKESNDMIGA